MGSRTTQVKKAISKASEDEFESAGDLFESFIDEINEGHFDDFESFYVLSSELIKEYWPNCGMFREISSQLFAEYEIGGIDWIWSDSQFQRIALKLLEDDIHFGCFTLTEGRSFPEFVKAFIAKSKVEDCDICAEIGDGWICPEAYICEDSNVASEDLVEFYKKAHENYFNGNDHEKYEAISVLRSIAGNKKTPLEILGKLKSVEESSLRHGIRSLNGGMSEKDAKQNSEVSFTAIETLRNL